MKASTFHRGRSNSGSTLAAVVRHKRGGGVAMSLRLALVALAAFFFSGLPTSAQEPTSITLVGNTSATGLSSVTVSFDYGQPFTTGANAAGYTLTSVDIRAIGGTAAGPTYSVAIHSDSSTCAPTNIPSCPGDALGTLTNPATWPSTAGLARHDAPAGGINLDANTTYWVVVDVTAQGGSQPGQWERFETESDVEDAGGAADWSIGNDSLFRNLNLTDWTVDDTSMILAINGFPNADTTPPTVTGARTTSTTSIVVDFSESLSLGVGAPSDSAYTVTATAGGTARNVPISFASISGTLVIILLGAAVTHLDTVTVSYTKPTTGPVLQDAAGNEVASFTNQPVSDGVAPSFSSAAANGTTLTVTFDEPLDTSSAPAGNAFTVFATSESSTVNSSGTGTAAISGATVTVTLDRVVERGATLRMAYTAPATNPLQDASGNAVANILGQAVTNHAGTLVDQKDGCADATCPDAPTGSAVAGPRAGQIMVTWTAATTGGAATKWQVKHTPAGGTTTTTPIADASTRTFTFTGLDSTKLHTIVVQAIGSDGTNDKFGDAAQAQGVRPADAISPFVDRASVDGTTLSVIFSEHLDQLSIPLASAFTVSVTRAGTTSTNTVDRVSMGNTDDGEGLVNLTLTTPVVSTDTVTVGYTKPSAGALQDFFANQVATFTGQAVTNNTAADTTAPTLSSAETSTLGGFVRLTFSEDLDANTGSPGASAYSVTATAPGDTPRSVTINSAALRGANLSIVDLDLGSPGVLEGDTVTVSYTKPTSGTVLQDAAGNEVASFTDQPVTNNTDTTAPTATSAVISDQNTVVITFSEHLFVSSMPGAGNFLTLDKSDPANVISLRAATGIAMSAAKVTLTFPEISDSVTHVRYTQPTINPLQDAASNLVASFDIALTIQSDAPTVASAVVTGDLLLVTFSEGNLLGDSSASNWTYKVDSVSQGEPSSILTNREAGTVLLTLDPAVTADQVVLLSFVAFAQNPLRSQAGVAIESFTDFAVTNNTPDEEEDDEVGVSDGEWLPVCTAEQANRRQRPGEWPPPNCRGGFYHEWEIPAHLISDPCDQPWQVPGSYRRDRGCLSR